MPRGRVELPTHPESFRGCSTAVNDRSRAADFSSVLMFVRFAVRFLVSAIPFSPRSQFFLLNAWLSLYDRGGAGQSACPDQRMNRYSAVRLSREECKPKPSYQNCQGGESNSRPRAYESPALPLSYPGICFSIFVAGRRSTTNPESFRGGSHH
jgi:hypothetical protein